MRSRHVAATVTVLSVGLTAAAALHRRTAARRPSSVAATLTAAPVATAPALVLVADREGVVLPFVRPAAAAPAPVQPAAPARCGDSGGVTKAGTPCAARATATGRCHHHRLAA